MSRTIDSGIITALQGKELTSFRLLELCIDSTYYRYTDCDVPLVVNSNRYTPRAFRAGEIKYSTAMIVDNLPIEIDDVDLTLRAVFVDGDPRGESVILSEVFLQSGDHGAFTQIGSVVLFEGFIDEWNLDPESLKMAVASLAAQWNANTMMRQVASCRWKVFKGVECGYAGSGASCDRSYSRCGALGNTDNFGGERFLPYIIGRTVWWGRVPFKSRPKSPF